MTKDLSTQSPKELASAIAQAQTKLREARFGAAGTNKSVGQKTLKKHIARALTYARQSELKDGLAISPKKA
jgi:ribosomal protein L29